MNLPSKSFSRLHRWHERLALLTLLSFGLIAGIIFWRSLELLSILSVVQRAERLMVIAEIAHELFNEIQGAEMAGSRTLEPSLALKAARLALFNERMQRGLKDAPPQLRHLKEVYLEGTPSLHDQIREFSMVVQNDGNQEDRLIISRRAAALSSRISDFQHGISQVIRVSTDSARKILLVTSLGVFVLLTVISLFGILPLVRRSKKEAVQLEAAKKAAQASKDEAVRANLSKTRFLANITHDLRSPLSVILGYVSVLKENTVDKETHDRYLDSIGRNTQHLLSFVNELLEISHNSLAPIKLNNEPYSIKEVLIKLQKDYSFLAEKRHCWLTLHGTEALPDETLGDRQKVQRILENLLGNAIKFCEGKQIDIQAQMSGKQIFVDVIDGGPGIPLGRQPIIFEPFASFNTAGGETEPGTGLGLAIGREHARAMGGDLELLRSEMGTGSTFRLTLVPSFGEIGAAESGIQQEEVALGNA